ncbi:TIGR01777 family oxidoreductase [Estrella lausannensis]|uniref:TIGR01777 family protein n=1 Tax=Estrella lausannensis TaxID=483423 RepID=A0A0H5E546_9BACT|nr:TIGR01777 family oxidoreductase [Estrella lausannensis]CRX38365.1 Conserved hypothetical protein [Estrella lausannensis]
MDAAGGVRFSAQGGVMKILISGASGFIGKALVSSLAKEHQVYTLVRKRKGKSGGKEIFWDIEKGDIETEDDFDAIINLAGENVSSGRWSDKRKEAILSSRVMATRTLVQFVLKKKNPPTTFINASAIGYYGINSTELKTEESKRGDGFLATVCEEWERALLPVKDRGVRTVFLRTGIVLGHGGGVLAKMALPFSLCLGGVIGDGSQSMSWVALDDLVSAVGFILTDKQIQGPVNMVSPNPVSNREFTKELSKAMRRPALIPMPKAIVRLMFGQMGDELLLSSQKVAPEKLLKNGFRFRFGTLDQALEHYIR